MILYSYHLVSIKEKHEYFYLIRIYFCWLQENGICNTCLIDIYTENTCTQAVFYEMFNIIFRVIKTCSTMWQSNMDNSTIGLKRRTKQS